MKDETRADWRRLTLNWLPWNKTPRTAAVGFWLSAFWAIALGVAVATGDRTPFVLPLAVLAWTAAIATGVSWLSSRRR